MSEEEIHWTSKRNKISIRTLKLWDENPRLSEFRETKTDREIIRTMLNGHGESGLKDLTNKIVNNDWQELDTVVALNAGTQTLIYEGNRRLVCLKLLDDPNLAELPRHKKFFQMRKNDFGSRLPARINVCIAPTEEDAIRYVTDRHTKSPTKIWDAADNHRWINLLYNKFDSDLDLVTEMTGINRADIKSKLISFRLREYVVNKSLLSEAEMKTMSEENFPWSSLDRILGYASIKEDLGLEFSNDSLTSTKNTEFFSAYIKDIFSRVVLGTKDKESIDSIHSRTNKDQADAISEKIKKKIGTTESNEGTSIHPLKDAPIGVTAQPLKSNEQTNKTKRGRGNGSLASGFEITSSNRKINGLFFSLQKISYNAHPVAVTLILRCILELSIRDFIDRKDMRPDFIRFCEAKNKNKGEAPTLNNAIEFLKVYGKAHIDKTVLQSFDLFKDSSSLIGSTSINLVAHSKTHALPADDIKKFWDQAATPLFRELITMISSH